MASKSKRVRHRSARILAGAAIVGLGASARADQLMNSSIQGDPATLAASGFGGLNGAGVNVGIVEAGGFANVFYANGAANQTSPGSALPNGNPDLPGAKITFVQTGQPGVNLPAGKLPVGNPPAAIGAGYGLSNHGTETTGVVIGQGTTAAADTGIAPGASVNYASLNNNAGGDVQNHGEDTNAATALQTVVQPGNTPIANMSWGFVEYQQSAAANQPQFLTNNAGTYGQAPAGSPNLATDGAGHLIPVYNLNAGGTPVVNNNGTSFISNYVDFAASQFNVDMIVAGNETPSPYSNAGNVGTFTPAEITANPALANKGYLANPNGFQSQDNTTGAPSDSYNSLNVGAMGARGYTSGNNFVVNDTIGALLNYGIEGNYNKNNMTSDTSPITHYGRFKTDIVAPGGDSATTGLSGTFGTPPFFDNLFTTTAGGQYTFNGFVTVGANAVPFYENDVFNGINPPTTGTNVTTASSFSGSNVSQTMPKNPPPTFPSTNPGGFANADLVDANSIAGTSFAAPLVAGANALLNQYGAANFGAVPVALDHRVLKAILLNGASHTYNGQNILGYNPSDEPAAVAAVPGRGAGTYSAWSRLPGTGITPLPSGTTLLQFGGVPPTVQPGLDPNLGTGMLNEQQSLVNYAAGRQTPGPVNPIGWDSQVVTQGTTANTIVDAYTIKVPVNGQFKATLDWDMPTTANLLGPDNTLDFNTTLSLGSMADLDLYLFAVNSDGSLGNNIDYSTSDIDNVEYLYDTLAQGTYQIDVVNAQFATPNDTQYGLAWSVPEPASLGLLGLPMLVMMRRRRRARA